MPKLTCFLLLFFFINGVAANPHSRSLNNSEKFTNSRRNAATNFEKPLRHWNPNFPPDCNTSTFYMRIKDGLGRRLELKELQTLPNGNFIAAGNLFVTASSQEGLVLMYSNAGVLLAQAQLKVDNKAISVFDMKVTLAGKILITGTVNDGTNSLFLMQLNTSLTADWTKLIGSSSAVNKITLQLFDDKIALASQQASSVIYSVLHADGSFVWSRETVIPDLVSLAGFGQFNWTPVGLVVNCFRNGKNLVELFDMDESNGNPVSSYILGDGLTENLCFETTSFSGQAHLLGVVRETVNDYRLVRNNVFGAATTETKHSYKISGTVDFNISGAMDNAGDAMGFCLPQDGKLVFIKQFSAYQTVPEYTRKYDVPTGASIKAVTRSFDGGFLFGLNTQGSDEIIFIKTDSIGTLQVCGFTDIPNEFHEIWTVQNTPLNRPGNAVTITPTTASVSNTMANVTNQFNCNQNYCPPAPVTDTCLSTYYKTFRSGSYSEFMGGYTIMRNDRRLVKASKTDRILGGENQMTSGLNLLDEQGNFIKGVSILKDGVSPGFDMYKMTDSTIMLVQYFVKNSFGCYNYTLIADDLQTVIWSKTLKTNQELINGGFIFGGYHRDKEGNFYIVGTYLGFQSRPKINVYKLDAAGNDVWGKSYEMAGGLFMTTTISSTNTALIIAVDAYSPGGVIVRIDKTTGQMLNSFLYQNEFNGSHSGRFLNFDTDRLLYFGNDHANQLLMGIIDTTGKPVKFKKIVSNPASFRTGVFKDHMFYGMSTYYDGINNQEALLKADTGLNIQFMTASNMVPYRLPTGMAVGDNGNIYVSGSYFYGWNSIYADAYIRKYNNAGTIGTCNFITINPVVEEVNPSPVPLGFTESNFSLPPEIYTFDIVPDTSGQTIANIYCSNVSVCDSLKIAGPDSICQINTPYSFSIKKNVLCLLNTEVIKDTANFSIDLLTDTSVTVTFKKPGVFWLKAFINTGCKIIRDSLEVHISQATYAVNLGGDTVLCSGDSLQLSAGTGFSAYQWQDGSSGNSFTARDSGVYFVKVQNQCGDTFTDSIRIRLVNIPSLALPPNKTICRLDTVFINKPPGFVNYIWQPANLVNNMASGVFVIPSQNTWIKLSATTAEGCKKTDSFFVSVNPLPQITLGADKSFCAEDSVRLFAGNGYAAYLWNTGSSSASITTNVAGLYWLSVTDANGCKARDSVSLSLYPIPQINLGDDFNVCAGEGKILDAGNFARYLWQDNSTSRYFTVSTTGLYFVQVTDANQCKAKDSIRLLNVYPLPVNFLPAADSICQYDKLKIIPDKNFATYLWSDNSTQPFIIADKPGLYMLTVKDDKGCIGNDTMRIVGKDCFQGLYLPTAFTPDGNAVNDVFRAKIYGVVARFSLEVYNRYGELVFATSDPNKGWDGKQKGKPADVGAYVWQCRYKFNTTIERMEKGTVMLIR